MSVAPTPRSLPDVAFDAAALARPLDWVGMDGIDLPLRIAGPEGEMLQVAASVDVAVDLADANARGIHMSRLYLQLQRSLVEEPVTPAGLRKVLAELVDLQRGVSTRARLRIRHDLLLLRPALASDNRGWKKYPVLIEATLAEGMLDLWIELAIEYSSTCPASAALSRQLNAERFGADFAGSDGADVATVQGWLASERGLAGTPHAQRSIAALRVQLPAAPSLFPFVDLIDRVEHALGTPVQTAVKREDEQAFAALNAANLMFCEDAARRVAAALSDAPQVARFQATMSHLESLHAHDAVARVSGRGGAANV